MAYVPSRRSRKTRATPGIATGALVLVLIGVFSLSVYQFRKPDAAPLEPISPAVAAPATASSLALAAVASDGDTASLHGVAGATGSGTATRSEEKGVYRLRIKSSPPEIDRVNYFYEGWLVRPIPYAYFSVGEMVTNDMGEFVLEWTGEAGKKYADYSQVVITLEAKDGNPDPSGHVLEGEFE